MIEKLEAALEWGGTKKDITFLVISAIAVIASFIWGDLCPIDPAWIAIVLCGLPIICEAIIGLVTEFDIKADVLVSIALIASIAIGEHFAAGEVAVIMQLGGLLEELTVAKAREGIEHLVEIAPRTARVVDELGEEHVIAAEDVPQGALIRVLPGETVPADGYIVSGTTSIDQSVMTGESVPVDKAEGDEVSSGTVNRYGAFTMKATKVGEDSSVARMAKLVESADAGKAKIVRMADRWATWIVVIALTSAAITWFVTGEIIRAVTILVVFCPCSLVLATPTAITAAIGNLSKRGVLVRQGDALERLAKVTRMMFDKTGTVTTGKLRVVCVESSDERAYEKVAALEAQSEHPLGKAIVASYRKEHGAPTLKVTDFSMLPGLGIEAKVGGENVLVGNLQLMEKKGVQVPEAQTQSAANHEQSGCTVSFIAIDGRACGIIVLADETRDNAPQIIAQIKDEGVTTLLATGDSENAAAAVAQQIGVDSYKAHCLPEDKLASIEQDEDGGQRICMVGDGVNDAPALRRAFVGVAMGGIGSDIAVEAADMVLTGDCIDALPHALSLARHMMRVIKANLTFSMTLNFVAIVLAMTAILNPVTGALVHNCGSVFVIVNSAFLLRWSKKAE